MRHKPSKALREACHTASELDYALLAKACLRACIMRDKDVYYRLPYFATVAEDFPKGILAKKDGLCDVFKTKTVKLCDWLFDKGFLPVNHKILMLSLRQMAYMEANVNSMLNGKISIDSEVVFRHNVGIEFVEENNDGS